MTKCIQQQWFFSRRKAQRTRVLRKMANMRASKERKRLAAVAPERAPQMERYYPLQIGVRDKRTGDVAWVDFKSVRDAARRLAVVQRYYR